MATTTPLYSNKITISCACASLGSSGTFLLGRESTEIDNSTDKYSDALVEGKVTVGTPTAANTEIQIWVYASFHTPMATTLLDVLDGTDSDETFNSAGQRGSGMRLGATIDIDTTTANRTYWFAPFSVAQLFGGNMPEYWGIFVTQNSGGALNSTAGNHEFSFTGIKYETA